MTINRFCSSGLQAVALAADRIRLGEADVIIAAGTESMSMVPMGGNKPSFSPTVFEKDENVAIAYGMGITAEKVAAQWKVSREEQDLFAAESHRRALRATDSGEFRDEVTPFTITERVPDLATREVTVKTREVINDEGPRRDTSPEGLARLKPAFAARGSITAGNSSQMSDGAGAVVVMSESAMKRFDLAPLGRFMGYAVAGVPPEIMGIGPVTAIPKVLQRVGLKLEDIEWIELNEAFAAQSLAVMREVGLDYSRVNPLGGAIALGHPLGATGAVRVATLLHGLRRHKKKYGMVTMCIGTGMGAAGVFEAVA
jgi:acetyl-CoA acyltransferase